ncbi:MAG TPA: LCP family protein [Solirubrobacterales bacterium]|nr:LCP family protein [Solirubrobacterales bacterium]
MARATAVIGMIPESFMGNDDEQRPSEPPDYKVYRARRGFFSRFRKPDLSSLRERDWRAPKMPKLPDRPGREHGPRPPRPGLRRALKWVGLAALGWILLSFLAFAVSAQLQAFKLSGEAKSTLHGNPFLLAGAQTILVLGTDARPPDTKEPGAAPSQECFEQQAHGDSPHGNCSQGEFRADTLMLIRAGGGAFRKLSIPRDSYAEIPGQSPQKINAAYAFGGAKAQIEAVEDFLGIEVDHVAIVDFTGFEDLIDAVGGVKVDVPHKLCADIAGGAGGGQGGFTLRLGKGENTLDGEKALIYSRIREVSECPGPGKSAYTFGYEDIQREKAQQAVIAGIKDRLTDPLRAPYNFIKGPIIGWDAPKAFVSDMGFLTMPQLILAAAIGGESAADVLCAGANSGCSPGPGSSIEVPDSERRRAVKKLLG